MSRGWVDRWNDARGIPLYDFYKVIENEGAEPGWYALPGSDLTPREQLEMIRAGNRRSVGPFRTMDEAKAAAEAKAAEEALETCRARRETGIE